jgi:FkbM family methyltransferase
MSLSIDRGDHRACWNRVRAFLLKPWDAKVRSAKYRWLKWSPGIPLPIKLPYGAWWLAEYDFCGGAIILGGFEDTEQSFIQRFLRQGMTVVDIGAHHGFYTLLASIKTGPRGRVLAFEPSLREREKLSRHLRLNRCRNVSVFDYALGSAEGLADLFLVEGTETGCNSLRPPNVSQPTRRLPVKVATLDACLRSMGIERVDFVKLDVEGAELDVLKGATQLLERRPRPMFMCEVQDIRTLPWGYPAKAIVDFLEHRDFQWFSIAGDHRLSVIPSEQAEFNGNYIAVPDEQHTAVLCQGFDMVQDGRRQDLHTGSVDGPRCGH